MLTTATATRRKLDYNDETDISESDKYDLEEKSEVEGNEEDEDDGDDNVYADASKHLLETWSYLAPPAKESDINGKWFAGIYQAKRTKRLCIRAVDEAACTPLRWDVSNQKSASEQLWRIHQITFLMLVYLSSKMLLMAHLKCYHSEGKSVTYLNMSTSLRISKLSLRLTEQC